MLSKCVRKAGTVFPFLMSAGIPPADAADCLMLFDGLTRNRQRVAIAIARKTPGARKREMVSGNHDIVSNGPVNDLAARYSGQLRVLVKGRPP